MRTFNVDSLEQVVIYLSLLIAVSFSLCIMQKASLSLAIKYTGFRSIYPTASFGTPIHELSHALMAIVFLHEIKTIKLFSPSLKTGVLGYVEHTHQANIYQKCGCFFIGIAPLLGGSLMIYIVNEIFFPSLNQEIITNTFSQEVRELSFFDLLSHYISLLTQDFNHLYDEFSFNHLLWLFLVSSIALHMGPSRTDFKNCMPGLVSLSSLMFCFYFVFPNYCLSFIFKLAELSALLIRMLFFALVLTLLPIMLMYAIKEIKVGVSKLKRL